MCGRIDLKKKKAGRKAGKSKWRRKQQVKEGRGFRRVGGEAWAVEKRSFLRLLQSSETSIQDQRVGGRRGRQTEGKPIKKRSGFKNCCRRKVKDCVGGKEEAGKKEKKEDNRHRKGAWSMS